MTARWQRGLTAAALLAAATAQAQAPLPVQPLRGKYCVAQAPKGWAITGENAAGSSFGADFVGADGGALASYWIIGVAPEMRSSPWYGRWYATPQSTVMATLSRMGSAPIQCGAPSTPAPGLAMMECRNPQAVGLALYQVHPMNNGGFVIVMRTAGTAPARWARDGAIASAVARSIRCNVPLKPSTADFTSGLSGAGKARRKAQGDSGYSRWLGMEHYHDGRTGENYWVSPSQDWRESGPQGPGYYVSAGGELRKLEPGRSN
ncbi:MAG: hypothetical protein M5U08_22250 [Burkholderiales bacterium]|nr:hypothetical protein [Burkholderiales bacterium]